MNGSLVRVRALALLALLAAACTAVGPDYEAPQLALPDTHAADLVVLDQSEPAPESEVDLVEWWTAFDDPVLDELIARAIGSNFDLRSALARIHEAEAVLGVERAARGPRSELSAAYTRSGISENTQFGLFPGQARESDDYTLGLGAAWEIDLWGHTRRMVEAASADLEARLEDHAAVRVSIVAQIADAYLRLREYQSRAAIASGSVELLEQGLVTARARVDAGLTEELDVLRALTELESARALLPELRRARSDAGTELELLLGLGPTSLDALLGLAPGASAEIPTPSGRVGERVPAELLRRRPDLRSAERQLAAQTARVGVATAELYPKLTLAGSIGLQAEHFGNLFESGSGVHSYGPSLSLPLFSGGGLRANIRAADARVDQALVHYESVVMTALHEVNSAATAIGFEGARLESLERAEQQAQSSLERSTTLYREGLTALDAVLDARRSLFEIEDASARARSAASRAHVDLYRALGGGWPGAEGD